MAAMVGGETGNFLAYAYAPATIVAPLGAVSVISNCLLAHYVLKERLCVRNLLGVALAITGSVVIVLYAPSSDRQLTMDVLVSYMSEVGFMVFVGVILLGILALYLLPKAVKKGPFLLTPGAPLPNISPSKGPWILGLYLLPEAVKKRYVWWEFPIVVIYILICSLTGALTVMCVTGVSTALVRVRSALTVMCIKGVSTALVLTLQGKNQFDQILPWAMIAVVILPWAMIAVVVRPNP
ncbi:magnesium transporter NIPA-domain-containing protein [Baffinella frigidus]|nr:magnesium transporter NIPA-domain-containing protein [Cryptophyta sp. CCMP2293]